MRSLWRLVAAGAAATAALGTHPAVAQWSDDAQKCFEIADNPDLAIHHCTKAINSGVLSDANLAITFNNRGTKWERKGDKDKALDDFSAAIRVDPRYQRAYRNRCAILLSKAEPDKALADCDEAIRLDANDAVAYLKRANIHFNKRDYDRALPDFDAAIRIKPDYAQAHRDRADIWYVKGDYDRAIVGFDEAIRLDPKDAIAFFWRGDAWFNKAALDRAVADYDASLALDPKNASVLGIRGLARLYQVNAPAAAADFAKAFGIEQSASRAAYLYLARAGMGPGGPKEARAELERNAAKLTDTSWPHPIVLYHLGTLDAAALTAAAEADADKRATRLCDAHYQIGKQKLLKGDTAGARASLRAAVEICPAKNLTRIGATMELARLGK